MYLIGMSDMRWSGPQIAMFMSIYKTHRALWDPTSPDYCKREERDRALTLMMEQLAGLGMPTNMEALKKRMKSYRDTYRNELARIIRSIERGKLHNPKLAWFTIADSFLRTIILGKSEAERLEKMLESTPLPHDMEQLVRFPSASEEEGDGTPERDPLALDPPQEAVTVKTEPPDSPRVGEVKTEPDEVIGFVGSQPEAAESPPAKRLKPPPEKPSQFRRARLWKPPPSAPLKSAKLKPLKPAPAKPTHVLVFHPNLETTTNPAPVNLLNPAPVNLLNPAPANHLNSETANRLKSAMENRLNSALEKLPKPASDKPVKSAPEKPMDTEPSRGTCSEAEREADTNLATADFFEFGQHVAAQLGQLPLESALVLQSRIQSLITAERLACISRAHSTSNKS